MGEVGWAGHPEEEDIAWGPELEEGDLVAGKFRKSLLPFRQHMPQSQPRTACLLFRSRFLFAVGTQVELRVKGEGLGRASLPKMFQLEVERA